MGLLAGLIGEAVSVANSTHISDAVSEASILLGDAFSGVITDAVHVASSNQVQAILQMVAALQIAPFDWPPNASVKDGESFDYIVVGCGAAGSVIANRLTEIQNASVLCVEAGGDPLLSSMIPLLLAVPLRSKQDYNYYTEDDGFSARSTKDHVVEFPAGKMLGGSSSLDDMIETRGAAADFILWAEAAADDSWGWDGIYKYFLKGEKCLDKEILNSEFKNAHGTSGYLKAERGPSNAANPYLEAFEELGNNVVLDIFSNTSLGYTQPLFNIADGFRQSHAYNYLTPIKDRSNLHVLKNSEVTKIIFDDKKAVGVKIVSDNQSIILNARKEIIVSAGAFNTPKLLMLSGIGPEEHLQKFGIEVISDLPVGKNLQDHMSVTLVHQTKKSLLPGPSTLPSPFKYPGTVVVGGVALNKTQSYPDYLTVNGIFDPESAAAVLFLCSITYRYEDEICSKIIESNIGSEIFYSIINIFHPKSRGEVLLRSDNPSDSPLIKAGYMSDRRDLEDMVDYIEDFVRVENTTFFKNVDAEFVDLELPQCANLEFKSREYWRCYVQCLSSTFFQYSSTCPMGTVLDNKLSVRGVRNLRVADASAMPTTISGNIKFAVTALAEKCADMIKDDYNNRDVTCS